MSDLYSIVYIVYSRVPVLGPWVEDITHHLVDFGADITHHLVDVGAGDACA